MWANLFLEPAKQMLTQIGGFLVTLVGTLIILVIGWLIANVIKNLVVKILKAIQLDKVAAEAKIDKFLAKGAVTYSLSEIIGLLCYWVAILITVVVGINVMGLTVAADLLNQIVLYIPNVIISIFILVLGMFVAALVGTVVITAAANAGINQAKLLGKIVETAVVIFSILIALEQLRIGVQVVQLTVTIVLASLGLGFALAFGLGCKDLVGRFVSDALDKLKSKR
jgi:hypothetical protein